MNLVIKGLIIGIGKIMPGVSGAMLAITLGEYDKLIENIANIKTKTVEKIRYLSKIGIGIILAIILTSRLIVKCLNNYYLLTMLLFIGIIIGGIPEIIKTIKPKKKDIIISIICIIIIAIITKTKIATNEYIIKYTIIDFIKLIGIGIIDSISSIVPGISGTAILMSLGYYNTILKTFATATNISLIKTNIFILIPFILGFILGTIFISKLINIIIKRIPNILNIIITIFMTYTTMLLLKNTLQKANNIKELILGIILFISTLIATIKISNKTKQKKYI